MLKGVDPKRAQALGKVMQATGAAFVKTGDPNSDILPPWPRYEEQGRWTLRVDTIIETVGELGGVSLQGRGRPELLGA